MRTRLVVVASLAFLLSAAQCTPSVYLVDADVDDDGLVTLADVAFVESCLGVDVRMPPPPVTAGGCPVRPPKPPCAAADVDGTGFVTGVDVSLVQRRLGLAVCNGSDELCDRRFNDVVYATTHNAMAAELPPWSYAFFVSNQCDGVPVQLDDGIRALMLDIHWYQAQGAPAPDLFLCHSGCSAGRQLLVDGLVEIREFLDAHPAEILSFIIETNADTVGREAQIRDAFAASGLLPYVHVQTAGTPWPTLGEMIASDRRLVVLTDDSNNTGCGTEDPCPWYHYLWSSFAFETPFSNESGEDFVCSDLRGQPGNDLFILNHFLTVVIGTPVLAETVNYDPDLTDRARECWAFQGRVPNFVTVDFYEIGDVLRSVNALNYLWGQTGGAAPW